MRASVGANLIWPLVDNNGMCYYMPVTMIATFKDKDAEALHVRGKVAARLAAFASVAKRKLSMLDAAATVEDLRSPPGNRLEPLSGKRKGQWSIRINGQYRLCFEYADGKAYNVEITDYH